jgi:hypothetical protein
MKSVDYPYSSHAKLADRWFCIEMQGNFPERLNEKLYFTWFSIHSVDNKSEWVVTEFSAYSNDILVFPSTQ